MRISFFVALFACASALEYGGDTIPSPPRSQLLGPQDFTITANLTMRTKPMVCANGADIPGVAGKIVGVGGPQQGCHMETQAKNLKDAGALGQLYIMPPFMVPGRYIYSADNGGLADTIPVVEVNAAQMGPILSQWQAPAWTNGEPTITLKPTVNEYEAVKSGFLWTFVFRLFIGPWNIVALVFAVRYFREHVKNDGGFNAGKLAQIGLLMEIIGCGIRAFQEIVDPFFSTGLLSVPTGQRLIMLSAPFGFTTTILVAFFWHASMKSNAVIKGSILGKVKIPIGVCVLACWVMELVTGNMRATHANLGDWVKRSGQLTLLTTILSGLFFLCSGGRVLSRLASGTQFGASDSTRLILLKMTKWLLIGMIGMTLSAAGMFIAGTQPFFYWTPNGQLVMWTLTYTGLTLTSFSQIMAFSAKSKAVAASKEDTAQSSGAEGASEVGKDGSATSD